MGGRKAGSQAVKQPEKKKSFSETTPPPKKENPAISSYLQCPVFSVITWQELTTSKECKHKMRVRIWHTN